MLGPRRAATRLLWSWAHGRLTRSDPSGTVTKVQGQFNGDRLLEAAKLLQHFGFASLPPADTDLLAACPSGEPTSALIVATNSQAHRPPSGMKEGDVALYDVRGVYVLLGPSGPVIDAGGKDVVVQNAANVTVKAGTKVRLETPRLEVTGDIVDHCDDETPTLKTLRDDYNTHQHTLVQPGSGVSGPTNKPAQ